MHVIWRVHAADIPLLNWHLWLDPPSASSSNKVSVESANFPSPVFLQFLCCLVIHPLRISLLPKIKMVTHVYIYMHLLIKWNWRFAFRMWFHPELVVQQVSWKLLLRLLLPDHGHASCKMLLLQHIPFLLPFEFHGDHRTVTNLRWIWPPWVFEDITGCTTVQSICLTLSVYMWWFELMPAWLCYACVEVLCGVWWRASFILQIMYCVWDFIENIGDMKKGTGNMALMLSQLLSIGTHSLEVFKASSSITSQTDLVAFCCRLGCNIKCSVCMYVYLV